MWLQRFLCFLFVLCILLHVKSQVKIVKKSSYLGTMRHQVVQTHKGKFDAAVRIITENIEHDLLKPFLQYFHDVNVSKPFYPTRLPNYEQLFPEHWQEEFINFQIPEEKRWKVVGVVKAHIRACANILESGRRYGVVFEDDTKVNPNLLLDRSIQAIPGHIHSLESMDTNWGALLLGWCAWLHNPVAKVRKENHVQILRANITELLQCTHAYAISRTGAKAYIEWHQGFRQADTYFNDLNRLGLLRLYYLKIPLFVQPWQVWKSCENIWYPNDFKECN